MNIGGVAMEMFQCIITISNKLKALIERRLKVSN